MAAELDGDLGVDVLIIGAGIQGLYLARSLQKQYSVCLLADPHTPSETADSAGYFSAGYTGNDVARIQPARRASGYWKLWAESNGVAHDLTEAYAVIPADEAGGRARLWADAQLGARATTDLPPVFAGGSLEGQAAYLTEHDVVVNPTDLLAELRRGLEDRIIVGEVLKFGLVTDRAIDFVEVQLPDERVLPITPRYVVAVANVANGQLLQRLVSGFHDRHARQDAAELVRGCQAVRRVTTVVLRGAALPLVAGHFDDLTIAAHPGPEAGEVVWVVQAPVDDHQTVLGPEDVRFEPALDVGLLRHVVHRLFSMSPELARLAPALQWGVYTARKTEHPMMAVRDTTNVAQPAPARLETFGLQGFVAAWPSHLAYAMIVGDVLAERVQQALGPRGDFSDGAQVADVAGGATTGQVARWEQAGFAWHDWEQFAATHDLDRPA